MIDTSKSMMYFINNLNTQNERISYQMASGKVINKGSDDSIIHSSVINLDDKLRVTQGLSLQLTKTKALNDTADSSIEEVKLALEKIKIDLLKGLNDGMDRSDKLALATNLEGIRGNIFDAVNTDIDGEYIFSGSDTTAITLVKDGDFELNGRINYGGDGFLRKIAVQPGVYRDRGVTAYDVSFYTSSRGIKDSSSGHLLDDFNFEDRERIIDENGYEWKVIDPATNLVRNPNDPVPPLGLVLQQYNHQGEMFDPSSYPESRIVIDTVTTQIEADSATSTDSSREKYTILSTNAGITLQPDSRVFEAKHSYFDDLNKTINALKGHVTKLDGTKGGLIADGNETFVDDLVRNGLDQTSKQYDASNIGHGELGGRNSVFEGAIEKLAAQETHYNILIQETNGADLAKLAMDTKALEMTYQALYTTISKMNQLSLLKFMN